MGKNAAEGNRKKGKIAEEIRKRIGRSVLIAYIVVEVIIVIIMGQTVYYNKKAQLTLESESAANRLAGFFEKSRPVAFGRAMRQLTLSITSTSVITHSKRSLAHCPCNWRSCDMSVVSARMALKNCDIVL
jgi:hypothetical protein